MSDESQGYSRAQIALHWIVAALILFQLLFHDGMEAAWRAVRRGQEAAPLDYVPHVLAGLAVLALTLWRLGLRARIGAPPPPEGPDWQRRAAIWTHRLIYLALLAIPLTGLAAWFGGIEAAASLHQPIFLALLALVLLHVLAVIQHQWIVKDRLLARMMKARR